MKEKTQDFRVVEFDGDLVWLESLEGSKRGLQFGVKATDSQKKKLEEEDKITATLKSLNKKNTAWKIKELQ